MTLLNPDIAKVKKEHPTCYPVRTASGNWYIVEDIQMELGKGKTAQEAWKDAVDKL